MIHLVRACAGRRRGDRRAVIHVKVLRGLRPRRVAPILAALALMTGVLALSCGAAGGSPPYRAEACPIRPVPRTRPSSGSRVPWSPAASPSGTPMTSPKSTALIDTYAGGTWTSTALKQGLAVPGSRCRVVRQHDLVRRRRRFRGTQVERRTTTRREPLGRDLDGDEPSAARHGCHGFFGRRQLCHGGMVRGRRILHGQPRTTRTAFSKCSRTAPGRPKSVPPLPPRPNRASGPCSASRPPRVTRWASTAISRRRTAFSRPCRGATGRASALGGTGILDSLSCISSSSCLAVGSKVHGGGYTETLSGTTWTGGTLPHPGGEGNGNGMFGVSCPNICLRRAWPSGGGMTRRRATTTLGS